jgi:hypothetical protein
MTRIPLSEALPRPVDATLGEGWYNTHQRAILGYYLAIPDDDLLFGFRRRRMLPSPGTELGGWYGGGVYHVFGQILGGLARLHRATGDPLARDKALSLLSGFEACVEEDGYAFQNRRNEVFDPLYEYEKLLGGLLDCFDILGVDCAATIRRITRWAEANLDRSGSSDPTRNDSEKEWHTLSENLYRAFQLLGDDVFLELAGTFEYPYYWNRFLDPGGFSFEPRHAYSHVNNLSGAAMAYRVKGDLRYLEICIRAYDEITRNQLYATGGYGPAEKMFGTPGYLGAALLAPLERSFGHCEIDCCSYAVFKLSRYLLEATGDARFADWPERMMYNVLGAQPVPRPGGFLQYYAEYYRNGGSKRSTDGRLHDDGLTYEWPCCSGTLPQAVAEYSRLVFYTSDDTLYVTQYLPASVDISLASGEIRTRYPFEDEVEILFPRISNDLHEIALRVPTWCREFTAESGSEIWRVMEDDRPSDSWLRIPAASVRDGRIMVHISQHIEFIPVDAEHPNLVALRYGPLVYAADKVALLLDPSPGILEPRAIDGTITTQPGVILRYPQKRLVFRPLMNIPEGEPYYLYLTARTENDTAAASGAAAT